MRIDDPALDALRQSESRYRRLFEAARDGILLLNVDTGQIEDVNPYLTELLGYSHAEFMGKMLWEVGTFADAPQSKEMFRELQTKGYVKYDDLPLKTKAGAQIQVEFVSNSYDCGGVKVIQCNIRDITERNHGEEKLRRLGVAMDAIADAIYLVDRSSMGFIYVNAAACRMQKKTRGELHALGPEGVLATSRAELERAYDAIIASGVPADPLEMLRTREDGSQTWVELRRDAQRSGDGWLIVTLVRDITKRKDAETARKQSETRFGTLFNQAAIGMAQAEFSGHFVQVNKKFCQMLGYTEQELLQLTFQEITHPEDLQKNVRLLEKLSSGEINDYIYEKRYIRKDGLPLWVSVATSKVVVGGNESAHILTIVEDVSERKPADDKIRRLNRVYAVLSGINALIVHERDRNALYRDACNIAVQAGQFRLAWIGITNNETQNIEAVAWSGYEQGHLSRVRQISGANGLGPAGLAAKAIATKKHAVCNDIESDTEVLAYPEEALARGYRSAIGLPLFIDGEAIGALHLYAGEPDFFDEQEIALLNELAGDISFALEHIANSERLEYLAYYDELTGLANAALFRERVGQSVNTATRDTKQLAVVMLNVERFKTINDALGRNAGDTLLKQIAERARCAIADSSWLARIGGDHFAAVFPDIAGADAVVRQIIPKYNEIFDAPFDVDGTVLHAAAKLGIAMFPDDGADADTILRKAESALKNAKASGERYMFYTHTMTERVAERLDLESRLRRALANDEFVLHYQPKVDLETSAITGVEALIRWNDPITGLVPPADFIPLMEETGLILEVGAWALQRAVLDHRYWIELGLPAPRIAVNVSPIQLRQRDFVETVRRAIAFGVSPTGIDLEITESLIMEDVDGNIAKLHAIRDMGITIFIDDFGTGYSSLGYLATLPVQALKIDRSFVITMLQDPKTMLLVSTIISLAHSLKLKVVAEGVDMEEQAQVLRAMRCEEMQGYLFSKPVPRDEISSSFNAELGTMRVHP